MMGYQWVPAGVCGTGWNLGFTTAGSIWGQYIFRHDSDLTFTDLCTFAANNLHITETDELASSSSPCVSVVSEAGITWDPWASTNFTVTSAIPPNRGLRLGTSEYLLTEEFDYILPLDGVADDATKQFADGISFENDSGSMRVSWPISYSSNDAVFLTFTGVVYNYGYSFLEDLKYDGQYPVHVDGNSVTYAVRVGDEEAFDVETKFTIDTVVEHSNSGWLETALWWNHLIKRDYTMVHLSFDDFYNEGPYFRGIGVNTGYDEVKNNKDQVLERWLVVPLNDTNECEIVLNATGKELYFTSTSGVLVTTNKVGQTTKLHIVGITAGTGKIEAHAGSSAGMVMATLNVHVLPRRTVEVVFTTPVKEGCTGVSVYTNSVGVIGNGAARASTILGELNNVWNKQANIYFEQKANVDLWKVQAVHLDWQAVCAYSSLEILILQGQLDLVGRWYYGKTINFIFVKNVEQFDNNDNTDDTAGFSGFDTYLGKPFWYTFLDGEPCSYTASHEAGHLLGRTCGNGINNNFSHPEPGQTGVSGDWEIPGNLMQVCLNKRKSNHITAKQAKVANDFLGCP